MAQERLGDLLDPIVIRTEATGSMLTYLEERAAAFPGLTLARSYIRRYPYGSLAAQLLGYDGQIPQGDPRLGKDGYQPGDVIGLTGIERGVGHVPAWRAGIGARPGRLAGPPPQSPGC